MDLSDIMEFDHVIEVHCDGTVTDAPSWLYAPNLHDNALDSASWTLMNGYSGQYVYRGPVMHDTESIGGKMAEAILDTPGYYVAIVASWSPECGDDGTEEDFTEGWAVARYCSHSWVAGMMYVHPEDLGTVMAARGPRGAECQHCEYVPVAGRDY